jgi:hypothetical protein
MSVSNNPTPIPLPVLDRVSKCIERAIIELRYYSDPPIIGDLNKAYKTVDELIRKDLNEALSMVSDRHDIPATYRIVMSFLEARNNCPNLDSGRYSVKPLASDEPANDPYDNMDLTD